MRTVSDSHVHLICRDGCFDDLPSAVRHLGPWQALRRGEIENLRPEYRRALKTDGYVVVHTALALFKPEG